MNPSTTEFENFRPSVRPGRLCGEKRVDEWIKAKNNNETETDNIAQVA
jgi:hypothetical protein